MMSRKERLPKYVSSFIDNRGTRRYRFRKAGHKGGYFEAHLQQAIDAMPKSEHLCFVPSERGKPYSAASFGNMFAQWCNAAGLPHCRAHGLRKAISRRLAEEGIGNAGIKSVTLHSRDEEVSLYVAAADQKRLAKTSIDRISERHMSSGADEDLSSNARNG